MQDPHANDGNAPEPESSGSGRALSDAEAVAAVLAGDTEAFEFIVRRHEHAVYGTLFRMLGDADEAADAAQEAFVKAYTHLGRYNPARPFKPWLFRIATNTAVSRQRQSKHRPTAPLQDNHIDTAPTPRQRAEIVELGGRLDGAVEQLTPDARELFDLRYRQDLSVNEIGHITGRKPNAIVVALHRVRARLRGLVFGAEETKPKPRETRT